MPLYDSSSPLSVESFTLNTALGILSNCPSVQELLEAADAPAAVALIKTLQDPPQDGEAYTKDELAAMGTWATLSPPMKGTTLMATQSGASAITDLEGELWFRIHRLVRDSEYYVTGYNGREDVWNFVRDRTASIVEEFAAAADPVYNDGGLIPVLFGREGLPLYNPTKDFQDQGIFIETNFILHYGRRGGSE